MCLESRAFDWIGEKMFEVTEIAKSRLKELLKGKKDGSAIRIMSCIGG
jgi:Fe-S cluster assembly iron-binding protein IscA